MKIDQVFSGNFLKAEDLRGHTVRVTIENVEIKEFEDGKKIILSFHGKDKSLVANKTNANIIAENLGSRDTDGWIGQTIQLWVKKVEYAGKLVDAIRVVLEEKSQPQQQPSPVRPAVTTPNPTPPSGNMNPPDTSPDDLPF